MYNRSISTMSERSARVRLEKFDKEVQIANPTRFSYKVRHNVRNESRSGISRAQTMPVAIEPRPFTAMCSRVPNSRKLLKSVLTKADFELMNTMEKRIYGFLENSKSFFFLSIF
jgi:hypothetical protein